MAERNDISISPNQYPSNSYVSKSKELATTESQLSGPTTRKKASIAKKIEHQFFKSTVKDAATYVLRQVLLPAATKTVNDMLHKFIDSLMGQNGYTSKDMNDSPYVSYRRYYDEPRRTVVGYDERRAPDEIEFYTKDDAIKALKFLQRRIANDGSVQVGTFYDYCHQGTTHTDFDWGWFALDEVGAIFNGKKWTLDLPAAQRLKR